MPRWTRRQLIGSAAAASALPGTVEAAEPHPLRKSIPRIPRRVQQPEWLAATPGLYCATPVSAGATTLCFTEGNRWALCRQLDHFDRLPELLTQARRFGLSTVYLVDWYEGDPALPADAAWRNKGDYRPRTDLGGEAALVAGIQAIQRAGGRVVSYLEPWVVSKASTIGKQHGEAWSIHDDRGALVEPYPWDWKLCPAHRPWVDWLVGRAESIVGQLGFDGVFLDSWGFERGRRCRNPAHDHRPDDPEAFDRGVRDVAKRIHEAVTALRPDAAVLCEGSALPDLHAHIHASFDWGIHTLKDRALWQHPGRVFTAGWSLDAMHEILGLGHKWVLTPWWSQPAATDPSCVAALQRLRVRPAQPFRDTVARRYFTERLYRTLHQWRNAGIVQGRSVPELSDAMTPPRWYAPEHFTSDDAMTRHHDDLVRWATLVDEAVPDLGDPEELVTHLRRCLEARAGLEDAIRGRTPQPVRTGDDRLIGRGFGPLRSWVNLGNQALASPTGSTVGPHRLVWETAR